jgi:hypothetical protein
MPLVVPHNHWEGSPASVGDPSPVNPLLHYSGCIREGGRSSGYWSRVMGSGLWCLIVCEVWTRWWPDSRRAAVAGAGTDGGGGPVRAR